MAEELPEQEDQFLQEAQEYASETGLDYENVLQGMQMGDIDFQMAVAPYMASGATIDPSIARFHGMTPEQRPEGDLQLKGFSTGEKTGLPYSYIAKNGDIVQIPREPFTVNTIDSAATPQTWAHEYRHQEGADGGSEIENRLIDLGTSQNKKDWNNALSLLADNLHTDSKVSLNYLAKTPEEKTKVLKEFKTLSNLIERNKNKNPTAKDQKLLRDYLKKEYGWALRSLYGDDMDSDEKFPMNNMFRKFITEDFDDNLKKEGRSNKSSEATISSDDPDSPTSNEGGLMSAEAPQNNRTIVIETDQGWVAVPQINQFGEEYDEESLRAFIKDSGPVDPITQEELPVFEDEEEAQEYAKVTDEGDMPEAESAGRGYDSGSSEARGAMRALDDQEPVGMYHGGMMLGGCGDPLCPSCGDMSVGIDAISGNPIPPGSNEENVRDDIPAVLSDGEYVVPADVVRYHGLKTFMSLRDEAKFGLMSMYAEGQIQTLEEEYGCEDCDGEDCDCEYQEDTEYETPEENVVEKATPEIEEETMEVEEEEEEYSSDSKNTYRPSVKIAVMKK